MTPAAPSTRQPVSSSNPADWRTGDANDIATYVSPTDPEPTGAELIKALRDSGETGGIAAFSLPIEQYPAIAPPSVVITAVYPGADSESLQNSVTQVIEQELNGVEGFLYMASTSNSNGTATITSTGIVYTPNPGFYGTFDIFSYTISDGRGGQASAQVAVYVSG